MEDASQADQECGAEPVATTEVKTDYSTPESLPSASPFDGFGNLVCCKGQNHHQAGTLEQAGRNDAKVIAIPLVSIPPPNFGLDNLLIHIYSQYYAPPPDGYSLLTIVKKE
jgi:hypothetical protein